MEGDGGQTVTLKGTVARYSTHQLDYAPGPYYIIISYDRTNLKIQTD